jgi:hypothetical protein
MGGWIGKVIGGMVGQQTNLPNLAGHPHQQLQRGRGRNLHRYAVIRAMRSVDDG